MTDTKSLAKRPGAKAAAAGVALAALAAAFIAPWEGLRTSAYLDPIGVVTACYGETRGVKLGDKYTKAQCDAQLLARVAEFEAGLDALLTVEQELPQQTRAALLSWVYNVGLGNARTSTLVRKANARDWLGMCNELPRWNKAGGRVLRGLTRRREAERAMCIEGLRDAGMIP